MLYVFYLKLGIAPGPGRITPRMDPPLRQTGLYTVDALLAGNFPLMVDALAHLVLPGICLGLFTMGLIALNHVVINLFVDLLYGLLDPRVRYS